MGPDQLKELKRLRQENERLRRAVSHLTVIRRQDFWDRWRRHLREGVAHLFGLIMRRIILHSLACAFSFVPASLIQALAAFMLLLIPAQPALAFGF